MPNTYGHKDLFNFAWSLIAWDAFFYFSPSPAKQQGACQMRAQLAAVMSYSVLTPPSNPIP